MTERQIIVEHNGKQYSGHAGTIRSTRLGIEDHGILTLSITMEWPGGGVSLSGWSLDEPTFDPPGDRNGKFLGRVPTAYGFDYVLQVMNTVGVEAYERLVGQRVIALFEYSAHGTWGQSVKGIAHIDDEDKVFIPEEHSAEWKKRGLQTA